MACAKPPNPDKIDPPAPLKHPAAAPTLEAIRNAESLAQNYPVGKDLDAAIARCERLLRMAASAGLAPEARDRLAGRIETLKGFAQSRLSDNILNRVPSRRISEKGPSAKWVMKDFWKETAKRNAPTVIRALEQKDHWRSREYKEQLLRIIEGNTRIPDAYKEQLPHDVAEVLRVCPSAAGIVKAMTLRGQHTPLASSAKLGSDAKAALGSAYELMGTATLVRHTSTPVNGGPKLRIEPLIDSISFGDKSNMNREMNRLGVIEMPTRRTIECDVLIARSTLLEGYREIGIDFKHGSNGQPRYASDDLRNQVENVARAIRHGQLHEYHFVTNTTFGSSFREVVAEANAKIGHTLIGLHEHVTSIPPRLI
jgi:hypothetical protein